MKLKIGSRKSDLARWQSVQVGRVLEKSALKAQCTFLFKSSLGDQNLDTPLSAMGGKGVFTEDFQADLAKGVCDLVVHSWKDLPVEERAETHIAMTLERADLRDLLIVPKEVWAKAVETGVLEILTSSPRRVYNLRNCLSDLLPHQVEIRFQEVRGNVPTRLTKMRDQARALILAKAGLDRLLAAEKENFLENGFSLREIIEGCRFMVLPLRLNPPAAAQGALAIEILRSRSDLGPAMRALSDLDAENSARREREILKGYGGGCHQKIGIAVLERDYGTLVSLRGLTDQGEVLEKWALEPKNPASWSRARARTAVFPLEPAENSWFARENLPTHFPAPDAALLIARAEAWPTGFTPEPRQIIWTAGLQTWRKLAKAGVWVHGSCEGLGENEAPRLEEIVGPDLKWKKLSHDRSAAAQATYKLIPKDPKASPDLRGKTHFFWMSFTAFERARELYPAQIAEGFHACGPGATLKALSAPGVLRSAPRVFLDLEDFLRETLP